MSPSPRIHRFWPAMPDEPTGREVLGGKGYSLAAMCRAGLPVPPGFTVATSVCRDYYAAGRAWPEGLDAELRSELAWLEGQCAATFGQGLFVSVRSGAARSMPGMMDTVLDVGRPDRGDPWEQLRSAVTAVLESWESPRARTWRSQHGLRGADGTAVTVQAMFPSERSGVLFTVDPTEPDAGRMLVEAARGLGEAVVSGRVAPDVYRLGREPLVVLERRAGDGRADLDEGALIELARLGLRVEAHAGEPVDVEWGLAGCRLALLQYRPIKGLDVTRDLPAALLEEREALRRAAVGRGRVLWTQHNLAETLPHPTPLTWDVVGGFMGAGGFVGMYQDLGFTPSARVRREGFLRLVAGRPYADLELAAELFYDQYPLAYDADGTGDPLAGPPTRFVLERAGAPFLLRLPWHLWRMWRSSRTLARAAEGFLPDFERRLLPEFQLRMLQLKAVALKRLREEELTDEFARRTQVLGEFGRELLKPSFLAGHWYGRLLELLELALGPGDARALANDLLSGLPGDKTLEQNVALWSVARGERTMERFMRDFGHRAVGEFELARPRWSEDPSWPERMVARYKAPGARSPEELHAARARARAEAEARLPEVLRTGGAGSLLPEVRAALAGAQRHLPWRESGKHYFMMAVARIREVLLEMAERYELGQDVFFLRLAEVSGLPAGLDALRPELPARGVRWAALQRLPAPTTLASDDLEALGRPLAAPEGGGAALQGQGVAAGVGEGVARVLRSPEEAGDPGEAFVLVCSSTDPGWTPLFVGARGLVVERGGALSHGALVARELGIPAVVLPDATRLLEDGALVRVDGDRGVVTPLGRKGG